MVKLNKIYTRTGDGGHTGLGDGSRRSKDDIRVDAYGEVDSANAAIGVCSALASDDAVASDGVKELLKAIQNDLFDVGADLSTPLTQETTSQRLRIQKEQIEALEAAIDMLNGALEPLKSFVLPGGSKLACALHVARTAVRTAERRIVTLSRHESINPQILCYLNRLSDLLFVIARYVNHYLDPKPGDVLWRPGKNQSRSSSNQ
ncbi:MAG: cob(I)yrinic acid a,c-diamide adenosyltransferase [Pseudomonadota bacterium]